MTTQTFHVPDIHCTVCVLRLEGIEDELDGVRRITVSVRTQQMQVEYDEARVTPTDIITAVARHGYQANSLLANTID